jgi:hypothetical protein
VYVAFPVPKDGERHAGDGHRHAERATERDREEVGEERDQPARAYYAAIRAALQSAARRGLLETELLPHHEADPRIAVRVTASVACSSAGPRRP